MGDPECLELRFSWSTRVSFHPRCGEVMPIPSSVMPETSPDLYINEGFVTRDGSAVW